MESIAWKNARDRIFGKGYKDEAEEDDCFYCPCCGEPIYKDDYPDLWYDEGCPVCPICEEGL